MKNLIEKIGFVQNELERRVLSFPNNRALSDKVGTVLYYDKSESVKTRFYWISAEKLNAEETKAIHERIWNENKAELLFLEKKDSLQINYINTSPKDGLLEIAFINTNVEDSELLEKISKEHISTGGIWIEYSEALDTIKKQQQSVDKALENSLLSLRKGLDNIYMTKFESTIQRSKIIQALIDRTLFIKFLEDKGILNAVFYQKYFANEALDYKKLLENKDAHSINELFLKINEVFNNKLFETPEIKESDLIDEVLDLIAHTIKGTSIDGQLSLFDFQFDIIPIEFISHIYQIFLDDKKLANGIYYTPEGLANLVISETIREAGTTLDPSCGSGIFLVLAFRKMYKLPDGNLNTYERIQHRLSFIKENIFGIEVESIAVRLAVFSLYLEVLTDIDHEELKSLVSEIILSENKRKLFSVDFSDNIQEKNALSLDKDSPFPNKRFKYIIGNPPWFTIKKEDQSIDGIINYTYWSKNREFVDNQISQCFLLKIDSWSTQNTQFGFIVNSSNFLNESSNFQNFIFSSYRITKFFELYHLKEILFDYANEPACLMVFDKQKYLPSHQLSYISPRLNSFTKIFKTILIKESDFINISQRDLQNGKNHLRNYLIGNESDFLIINKLQSKDNYDSLIDIIINNKESYRGFEIWGEKALSNEYNEKKSEISKAQYESRKLEFLEKYLNKTQKDPFLFPIIKSSQIDNFKIKGKGQRFCQENIANYHRPRAKYIYEGEKIICTRIGGKLKAALIKDKIYFASDVYVLKLKESKYYSTITCCLNSILLDYFSQIKLRKRIDGSLSRLNTDDLEKLPIPKKINSQIENTFNSLLEGIEKGLYSFEDKKNELNDLVFDLYDLTPIEKQRVLDFYMEEKVLTPSILETYSNVFYKTIRQYLNGSASLEYFSNSNLPLDVAGVKIVFGNSKKQVHIEQVVKFINYQLLRRVGNTSLMTLRERIYDTDTIYILKDTNPRNWSKSQAYDDAQFEINKILKNE